MTPRSSPSENKPIEIETGKKEILEIIPALNFLQ